MFSRTVTRLATQRVGLLRQSRQSVRRFSEQAKDGSKAAPEAGSGAPPPPPPPPQSGGGGGGLFLLLGAGGAAYYFQDEIKKQLGMEEKQPVPAAAVAATGHPEPTPSDSVKPTVNEPIQEDVPEVVAPVTAPVQSENVAEPSTPTNTATGPVDWNEVRAAIVDLLDNENYDDGSYGPLLVRLAWHHAGTYDKNTNIGGSEGAGMRFKNESEWGANAGLNVARALLEPVKAQFPQVTYSDLWSFAGTVALEEMGANDMNWRSGRKDIAAGPSPLPDGLLPDADGRDHPKNPADHLRDIFGRMGFNDKEIVCLSGAHALGRCHVDRSGYWGPWTRAPTTLSNEYYRLLLEERWSKKMTHYGREWNGPEQYEDPTGELMMLPTDLALVQDEKMRPYVVEYANNDEAFQRDFAKAWIKLQELGVRRFHGRRRYLLFGPRE